MDTPAAIIPVAGLSSRMGRFKPLMELNGFPMIRLTVQSVLDGGAAPACVVTGRGAREVEAALAEEDEGPLVAGLAAPPGRGGEEIVFAHNPAYAETDMLQSIKLGLEALCVRDPSLAAAFVLPGDMPGISPRTFVALQGRWEAAGAAGGAAAPADVLVPTYRGTRGHPLLIGRACFDTLLAFDGEGGLRRALSGFAWEELAVDDPGILLDGDDPAAFEGLEAYIRKTRGVSGPVAEGLFALYGTPENVHEHTLAVAAVAHRMARALNARRQGLDSELCRSGGELHDLNRLEHDHSQVAAAHLRELGYGALAAVVGAHDRELRLEPEMFTEANIVFVADKLVKETTLVSIAQRYEGALKRFPPATEIGAVILRDSRSSAALLERYVRLTGDEAIMQGTAQMRRGRHADA